MPFDDTFVPPSLGADDSDGTAEISTEALWSVVGDHPSLVIVEGPEDGRRVHLERLPVVVGRSEDAADVRVDDRGISKKHFLISREGMAVFVQDLGSSNGTLVNGTRVDRRQIYHGDAVAAGSTVFQFTMLTDAGEDGPDLAQTRQHTSPGPDASGPTPADETLETEARGEGMRDLLDGRSLAEAASGRGAAAADGTETSPAADQLSGALERARVQKALAALNGEDRDKAFEAANFVARYGERAIKALGRLFPGRLQVDRYAYAVSSLPPVDEHGAVLRALVLIGEPSLRLVRHYIADQSNEVRFYATYLLTRLPAAQMLAEVGRRLFDRDQQIREVARHVAFGCLEHTGFEPLVLKPMRDALEDGDDPFRVSVAAEVVGQFHDVEAISLLIDVMEHHEGPCRRQAWHALRQITLQPHPESVVAWKQWWGRARVSPDRRRWLEEARESSDEEIRRLASQDRVPFGAIEPSE